MFTVDTMSRQPIYEQIVRQAERFILSGLLKPGDQLPSVRSLSIDLSVNPNTIQKAYAELDSHGILCAVPGRGCFVSQNAIALLSDNRRARLDELEELAKELALAGVSKQELIERVDHAYTLSGNK